MTMTLSPEALFDEATLTAADDWIIDRPDPVDVARRLHHDPTALAVWDAMTPLLDGSERSRRFWNYVPVTPLLEVPREALPADLQDSGHRLLLQADGAMPTGAYKFHGVMSALLEATEQDDVREVVGASTGNHAAALALGAAVLGLTATVFMPEGTVQAKVDNTAIYGARIAQRSSLEAALAAAKARGSEPGALFVHPYDAVPGGTLAVVAGQGTTTARLPEQFRARGLDPATTVFDRYEPAGGGGVAAGNGVSGKVLLPGGRLHVVQAAGANPLVAELRGGAFNRPDVDTAVDGAAVRNPGTIGRRVLRAPGMVDRTHVVSPAQIGEAMAVTARFTDLYEPAGAMALAAALADMRRDRSGASMKVVHGTGINTTPQKVDEFAAAAYHGTWHDKTGSKHRYLDGAAAWQLSSQARLHSRRWNELEATMQQQTAEREQRALSARWRRGTQVSSGAAALYV